MEDDDVKEYMCLNSLLNANRDGSLTPKRKT